MKAKHVLIFAKTKHEKTPYDQWLAGTDIIPIILTPSEYADSYGHLPHVYAFDNYDQNQLVEKTAFELGQRLDLIAVFARAEADIIRSAQLREVLNVQGQSVPSALAFRQKVLMKDYLQDSKVQIPAYAALTSAYTAIQFIKDHGYPVVIKPVSESGSLGTHIITCDEDFQAYLQNPQPWTMEIETFVEGQMYHIDGLIIDGEVKFITPFRYVNDCLSFREGRYIGHCSVKPEEAVHGSLVETTRNVLAALPTPKNTAFHAELWIKPNGDTIFCEVASRTGGGMISSLIKHSFNVDLDKEWFLAECGHSNFHAPKTSKLSGAINIFPQTGTLQHFPTDNEPDFVKERQFSGAVGRHYAGGVKSGLFLAGYVIAGATSCEILANIEAMSAWTEQNFKWAR